jgi:hypothetical protein
MDELKEIGHRSGCWYKHIKEEDNDYVLCRTGMTHISFKIDIKNMEKNEKEMREDVESYLELHKKINRKKDKEYQQVWNKLGYCGTMFLDWLDEAKKHLFDNRDDKMVMQIYIDGIKLIKEALEND